MSISSYWEGTSQIPKMPSFKTDFFASYSFWGKVNFTQMCWCEIFDKFEVSPLLLLFGGQVDTNVTALLNIFPHHRETSLRWGISTTFKAKDLWSLFLMISYLGDTAVLKGCVTFSKIYQKLPISISFKRCCHITRQHLACQFEHSVTSETPPFLHDSPHNITLTWLSL